MLCEICQKDTDFIKEHHIQSRCYGGENLSYNIACICSSCHDKVHYGLIIIEGRFSSMRGNVLVWRKFTEKSITDFSDPKVWIKPNSQHIQEKYLRMIKNEDNKRE